MGRRTTGNVSARMMFTVCCFFLAGFVLLFHGCLLPLPDLEDFPSTDPMLICSVTVRNPDAEVAFGVDEVPEQALNNRTGIFLADDGTVLREYYQTQDCIGGDPGGVGYGFSTNADAVTDWRLFVRQRIQEVAGDPSSSSVFAAFPGTWCGVPDTLSCILTDSEIGSCFRREALTTPAPLPDCPPSPTACLRIACSGEAPCTSIDFGEVPTGELLRREVQLSNCSEADAPPVEIILDGTVSPIGASYDFDIPIETNTCHFAEHGDGMVLELPLGSICNFWVEFTPENAGDHHGETRFISNPGSQSHAIELRGTAVGGALKYTVPDLPDPTQIPAELCVDAIVDGNCTAARDLVAENPGPGTVGIRAFLQDNQGFELAEGGEEYATELAAGESAAIRFRWCGAAGDSGRANLVVNSNTVEPTFARTLIREPGGCAPVVPGPVCGNTVIEAGEQCDDGNTVNGDGCDAACQTEALVCGNAVIEADEQCDDGNTIDDGNGCLADCTIDPTLIAAYGFEGTDPVNIIDVTGNGHTGTLQAPAGRSANGQYGNAVEFTGLGGHVDLTALIPLDIEGGELTIALWVRAADNFSVPFADFISKSEGTDLQQQYWVVATRPGQQTRFLLKTTEAGETVELRSGADLVDGEWTHIAVTYQATEPLDDERMKFYTNGIQSDNQEVQSGDIANRDPQDDSVSVWIGDSPPGGDRSFEGLIDEVRIYNRALDAEEITRIMGAALLASAPGP